MSGYPQGGGGNNYGNYGGSPPPTAQPYNYGGAPPQTAQLYNYGGAPPPPQTSQSYNLTATPYGAQPPPAPYGEKPHKNKYDTAPPQTSQSYNPTATPYGAQPPPTPYGENPHENKYDTAPSAAGGYGSSPSYPPSAPYVSPFATLIPAAFPRGTDPSVVTCLQMADQDGSGFIDDHELQGVLSSYNQKFSLRTVHLLMFHFTNTNTNTKKIGPKEFIAVFYSLQNWRSIFERFDWDRSGKIDSSELREALLSLGFVVSPVILDLFVSEFDKSGGRNKAIKYDNFIKCCLTVKGLTEKFKEKDINYSGSATFTYEAFMLTVLPFFVA